VANPPVLKSLGQHFLHQRSVIDAIVQRFNPQPEDIVVEIGPGRGVLTEIIAPRVAALHAVELDRRLAALLAERAVDMPNLTVHREDALKFDYGAVAGPVRVIGNLPYNVSTPLLFRLLDQGPRIRDMLLMLQREVVDRILAAPGGKTYGRLSVMVQQRCRGELVMRVAAGAFSPPPRVESAVVALTPETGPSHPVDDQRWFAQLVMKAFAQRRKTLRNALKGLVSEQDMEQCGIDPESRAERVTVVQFASLANRTTGARG
jgi:16S rRNA (adenine1518-N6/adenine1519-N6)-dimethyltransferase